MPSIQRQPLRTEVGAEIFEMVVDGRLAPGKRLNEVHLAHDLGISRTPLREAMLDLQADGVLASTMGRGFQVPPLDGREIAELLSTLALLEPAALLARGAADGREVMELQNLLARARLGRGAAHARAETLHLLGRTALAGCTNTILRGLVQRQDRLTLRYVRCALDRGWDAGAWLAGLEEVVEGIRRDDRQSAATRLAEARRAQAADFAQIF